MPDRFTPISPSGTASPAASAQPALISPQGLAAGRFANMLNGGSAFGAANASLLGALGAYNSTASGHPIAAGIQAGGALGSGLSAAGRFTPLSGLGTLGGALGGLGGLAGSTLSSVQSGSPSGAGGMLASAAGLANLAPAGMTIGGVPLATSSLANAGSDALLAGGSGALGGGASVAGALGGIAAPFAAFAVKDLINALLPTGADRSIGISKRLMDAKQTRFSQYGNQAQEEALKSAPSFQDAWRALSVAPQGTSGQVQFGIGPEYAGQQIAGSGGTTQTPGWQGLVKYIADPATVAAHPEQVASAIQHLWVQTGQGGATNFNGGATRNYQVNLLSKLPNTPDWLAIKQRILNTPSTDPRLGTPAPATDLPVIPNTLRVNGLKVPTDHEYRFFDATGGQWYPYSPERVAQVMTVGGQHNIFDTTTGKWVSGGNQGPTDPAYHDPEGTAAPVAPLQPTSFEQPSVDAGGWANFGG